MPLIDFACTCGKVKGQLSTLNCMHLGCFCKDCTGFARIINSRKSVPDARATLLDADGCCDLTHFYWNDVTFTQGTELIQPIVLTEGSHAVRSATMCCKTPMVSTLSMSWYPCVALPTALVPSAVEGLPYVRINSSPEQSAADPYTTEGLSFSVVASFVGRVLVKGLLFGRGTARPVPQMKDETRYLVIDLFQ